MKCLVVLAHPLPQSFCHAVAATVVDKLDSNGHEHRLIDLYRSGFDPRLTVSERAGYYGGYDKSALENEIADLQWAESIILVFPTWWFGPPAIRKDGSTEYGRRASPMSMRAILDRSSHA